jgi:Xaa-Pro aminopeptidase
MLHRSTAHAACQAALRIAVPFSVEGGQSPGVKRGMFQKFDDVGGPAHVAERVGLLREALLAHGLDGFLVPRADEHQNEYVPANAERLLWLTGFSGSWGLAAVLTAKAALFVDGRYTLQAAAQTDAAIFEVVKITDVKPTEWLAAHLGDGAQLGYDPRLHTMAEIKGLAAALAHRGATLVAVEDNPLTGLWRDRPPPPDAQVSLQPIALAGQKSADKLAAIQAALCEVRQDATVITALDSIAWLFNIRGGDLPHTPFVLSHAIVPAQGKPMLFIDGRKLSNDVRATLDGIRTVRLRCGAHRARAAQGQDPSRPGAGIALDRGPAARGGRADCRGRRSLHPSQGPEKRSRDRRFARRPSARWRRDVPVPRLAR